MASGATSGGSSATRMREDGTGAGSSDAGPVADVATTASAASQAGGMSEAGSQAARRAALQRLAASYLADLPTFVAPDGSVGIDLSELEEDHSTQAVWPTFRAPDGSEGIDLSGPNGDAEPAGLPDLAEL